MKRLTTASGICQWSQHTTDNNVIDSTVSSDDGTHSSIENRAKSTATSFRDPVLITSLCGVTYSVGGERLVGQISPLYT